MRTLAIQRLWRVSFIFFLLFSPALFAQTAPPAPELPPTRVGPIQLRDVPLEQLIGLLQRWTGKSILRPQTLPANTISLDLREEVSRDQGVRAIETLLGLNGVGVAALDEHFLKVMPLASAKVEAPELISGSTLDLPPSGVTASKLFHPKFLRISEFMPQITGLLNPSTGATPAIFEKANSALVTDSLTNLQRIETLLNEVDRPEVSHLQPRFYSLHFAKASELVGKLHGMFTGALAEELSSASYNADDRTNQIVLFADPQQYPVFDRLIEKLDVKSGEDTRTDIIYLKHAAAKDVASILTQLIAGQTATGHTSGQTAFETGISITPAATLSSAAQSAGTNTSSVRARTYSTSEESKPTPTAQFSTLLNILPEERSNSVVISGTENDIRLIRDLVAKIDVLLAQVRIEVVIAEVTLDDNHTSGISALGLQIQGNKLVGFSGATPNVGINGTVTYPNASATPPVVVNGPWDLAAQISISTTPRKTKTRILSVPNIVTTHNREGKIFVGQEVPVISSYLNDGATASANGGVGTGYRTTINSKDIGIQLSVKPLIGTDGSVQMEISQEVNDILGQTLIDGNEQPTIGRRTTDSFVTARSGEIIVLGGLQRTSQSHNTSSLGPIPLIGTLLGSRTRDATRTDLVFFLRPTVLNSSEDSKAVTDKEVESFPKAAREDLKEVLRGKTPETQSR